MNPVLTAVVGDNGDLFSKTFSLYVPDGSAVMDMTWGLGVFWKKIEQSKYRLIRNDIDPERGDIHQDFRCTGFQANEFYAIVLDPPYASRGGVRGLKSSIIDRGYNNRAKAFELGIIGNEKTMQFYKDGMKEAYRILHSKGVLFVKCMDEIMGGKQCRNHITIWKYALELGFIDEDLFVLVQKSAPTMRHDYQLHARKNNSFLWVFRKK